MKQYLLVITEDGYGKRVAVDEIRHTRRDAVGVKISRVSIAFCSSRNKRKRCKSRFGPRTSHIGTSNWGDGRWKMTRYW